MRDGTGRATLPNLVRVLVLGATLVVFAGWLLAPDAVRSARDLAASRLPLPAEASWSELAAEPPAAGRALPEGSPVDVAIITILVTLMLLMALGSGEESLARVGARFRRVAREARERSSRIREAGRRRLVPFDARGMRGYGRPVAFLLTLGLLLGWLSAPSFLRERELSVASVGQSGFAPEERSSRLLDGFSNWVGSLVPSVSGDAAELSAAEAEGDPWDALSSFEVIEGPAFLADVGKKRGAKQERRKPEAKSESAKGARTHPLVAAAPVEDDPPVAFIPASFTTVAAAPAAAQPASSARGGEGIASGTAANSDAGGNPAHGSPGPGPSDPADSGPSRDRSEPGGIGRIIALGEFLLRPSEDSSPGDLLDLLSEHDAEDVEYFPSIGYHLVRVDEATDIPALIAALLADPRVTDAAPNHLYSLAEDPAFPLQWSLRNLGLPNGGLADADIDADEAWERIWGEMGSSGSAGVAVLDTGFAPHSDYPASTYATSVVNDPVTANPDHGTKVAGILAADGGNGIGIAGVNPRWARLVLVKVFQGSQARDSDIIRGIELLERLSIPVRVVNLSVEGFRLPDDLFRPHPLCNAIRNATNNGKQILFVVAAGNEQGPVPSYPAACGALNGAPNVISVASSDRFDVLALTSNFGLWVDLAAPGESVYTTTPSGWGRASGTSMAAPQVAGVASLIFAVKPGASAADAKRAILGGVDVLPQMLPLVGSGGRLNACRALQRMGIGPRSGCDYSPGG